jgi:hypothetical protein
VISPCRSWKLAAVTSNSLLNDDSFEFAKAAKEVGVATREKLRDANLCSIWAVAEEDARELAVSTYK